MLADQEPRERRPIGKLKVSRVNVWAAGFVKTDGLHSLRIEGKDRPVFGAELTQKLAVTRINLRGSSAAAMRGRFVADLALDTPASAKQAMSLIATL